MYHLICKSILGSELVISKVLEFKETPVEVMFCTHFENLPRLSQNQGISVLLLCNILERFRSVSFAY